MTLYLSSSRTSRLSYNSCVNADSYNVWFFSHFQSKLDMATQGFHVQLLKTVCLIFLSLFFHFSYSLLNPNSTRWICCGLVVQQVHKNLQQIYNKSMTNRKPTSCTTNPQQIHNKFTTNQRYSAAISHPRCVVIWKLNCLHVEMWQHLNMYRCCGFVVDLLCNKLYNKSTTSRHVEML